MRHRHLDLAGREYTIAAIDSVLERGGAGDIYDLLREIRRDPFGPVATAALESCKSSEVYGYPALIENCIRNWRDE